MSNSTPIHHVLVADDELYIGRIIKMKLEQGLFTSRSHMTVEALEVLERESDIGLRSDLMMPI